MRHIGYTYRSSWRTLFYGATPQIRHKIRLWSTGNSNKSPYGSSMGPSIRHLGPHPHRACWQRGKAVNSLLIGARFESRPGYWLSRPKIPWFSLIPTEKYPNIRRFTSRLLFSFSFHQSSYHTVYNLGTDGRRKITNHNFPEDGEIMFLRNVHNDLRDCLVPGPETI
jgi:hypothetical protein